MHDVDELLTPAVTPGHAGSDAVFLKTVGVLRRRRWLRRGRVVVALAACYLAGVVTMRLLTTMPQIAPAPEVADQPSPKEMAPPETPIDPYRNDPPDRIERWANLAQGEK